MLQQRKFDLTATQWASPTSVHSFTQPTTQPVPSRLSPHRYIDSSRARENLKISCEKRYSQSLTQKKHLKLLGARTSFPFGEVKGLHLCSMVILDATEQSDPYLVFEATFDGSREEFLNDLLRVALEGLNAIYENCAGYPKSKTAIPELIKDYLVRHDVGAQTFYSGSPGRTVAQIKGERDLHEELVHHVCQRRSERDPPTTFLELQRELQREVIRKQPNNRWAEQPAVPPWEVTWRSLVAASVGLALLTAACGVGALALFFLGWSPTRVTGWLDSGPLSPLLGRDPPTLAGRRLGNCQFPLH